MRVLKEAKDIVQQSLMKGFVNFCQFQGQSSFTARDANHYLLPKSRNFALVVWPFCFIAHIVESIPSADNPKWGRGLATISGRAWCLYQGGEKHFFWVIEN